MSHALIYARTMDNVNLPDTLPALTPSIESPFRLVQFAVAVILLVASAAAALVAWGHFAEPVLRRAALLGP